MCMFDEMSGVKLISFRENINLDMCLCACVCVFNLLFRTWQTPGLWVWHVSSPQLPVRGSMVTQDSLLERWNACDEKLWYCHPEPTSSRGSNTWLANRLAFSMEHNRQTHKHTKGNRESHIHLVEWPYV